MVSLTVPLEESFKAELDSFVWVSWSEVGAEAMLKRDIFDRYVKTRKLSAEEQEFCDEIDWHPVDWLPLRKEFVEELKKAAKEPAGKLMTLEEFNKWCDNL